MKVRAALRALLIPGLLLSASAAWAQKVDVTPDVKHDTSGSLGSVIAPTGDFKLEHEKHLGKFPPGPVSNVPDPVVQSSAGAAVGVTSGSNILGVGRSFVGPNGTFSVNAAPPDTNGAIGATQYVQWVNSSFAVFDKATGNVLLGPTAGNALWSGFGGDCETHNDGDPIAQYDKAANRWVLTQFSLNTSTKLYYQCVAVSTTSDATGTYFRYAFLQPELNDYPKLSVWPDAYYITFNMFGTSGSQFSGGRACAMDRAKMLTGAAATQVCFQSTSMASLLPADLDGSTPPAAGTPNFLMSLGTSTSLRLYKFHVDFATPANSTFTGPVTIPVASYSSACGGGDCVPQVGTAQLLDSLSDRLMYRLAYRNFGDHEALVVNHSVTAGTSIGVRWYEIRNPAGVPTVFQQGTFAPDNNYRWMGSVAMDKAGDIAVGYSTSSGTTFPSIRYTGRVPGDPLGTLQAETIAQAGAGSQTGNNLARWGDYTAMTVDPVDDCTFWYTNEYLQTTGSFNWSTRISSFKFPGCGSATPDFSVAGAPASQTVIQGGSTSYTASITASNGFAGVVTLSASGLPTGASAAFVPSTVTGSGTSTLTVTTGAATPTGSYVVTITGTSGALVHATQVTLVVNPGSDFSISATPASQSVVQGSGTSYTATVTALNGFAGSVTLSASGLPSGAGATFAPASITGSGSSTMTVTTGAATPAGSYPVTITGTSGSLVHSTQVTLVVNPAPDFSISATPVSRSVVQGSGTTYSATVAALNGFGGVVTFSATGLPAGSGATFAPTTVTGSASSTMTVTTSASIVPGNYPITITGTSGTLMHSVQVTLVVTSVTPPDFSLSASPNPLTIKTPASGSSTITVNALNGFTGAVALSVTGLPVRATASFSSNSVAAPGTSTLTINTNKKTVTGTVNLTVTGVSGTLTRTVVIPLTIN
jgi:hypothetical protein